MEKIAQRVVVSCCFGKYTIITRIEIDLIVRYNVFTYLSETLWKRKLTDSYHLQFYLANIFNHVQTLKVYQKQSFVETTCIKIRGLSFFSFFFFI